MLRVIELSLATSCYWQMVEEIMKTQRVHLSYCTLRPTPTRPLARPPARPSLSRHVTSSHHTVTIRLDLISMHAYQISTAEARGKDACAHAMHRQPANTLSLASE